MSTQREWKPGTLIADEDGERFFIIEVSANTRTAWGSDASAVDADGNGWRIVHNARPLVVIDPESDKDVERLWRTWITLAPDNRLAQDNMQAALRSLIEGPKPDEPPGLGAVVEDEDGARWVRSDVATSNPWRDMYGVPFEYEDIHVVKVLSEGVTP